MWVSGGPHAALPRLTPCPELCPTPRPTHPPAAAAAERLLAEGASPWSQDCNQRLPLHFASEAGHVACVRLLAAHMRRSRGPAAAPAAAAPGVAPAPLDLRDQNGQTPVQLAAEHGHPDCTALLLDADGTGGLG